VLVLANPPAWRACSKVDSVKLSPYSTTLSCRLNTVMVAPRYRSSTFTDGTLTFFKNVRRFLMSYISISRPALQYISWYRNVNPWQEGRWEQALDRHQSLVISHGECSYRCAEYTEEEGGQPQP